ncbi:tyrosine-type recombinase/integrase [Haloferax larsenii]|uniref:Phage integrase, N-terminal SAM-like domain n=1 Tax=Haloferax larsenii TaxID=302484 RepID=A0A1H7N0A2_HALLR|nr:site-specific integrase [Haloferax larsenii]SEL16741.1 Phage integrase, N-terminal SAM-like domain [Haloferax larsenii]
MALKPTPPHEAMNRFLKDKKPGVTHKTLKNYRTTLRQFCDWLDTRNVTNINGLDSEIIQQYKEIRLTQVKVITARLDMMTIKQFIEFCEHIQAVPRGLAEMIRIPKTDEEDEICDDILTRQEAIALLDYLNKYQYATNRHVSLLILWKTGMRLSGLRALDIGDFDEGRPALEIRHRPATGTPLKNKSRGERDVLVTPEVAEVVRDYIDGHREDVEDEYSRKPLLASKKGRLRSTTIQRYVYTATRPCYYNGGDCPFEQDPDSCEAMTWNTSSKCPGSVSPHALRRGYVTAARNAGQPKDVTGERVNMSGPVLEKHYDKGAHNEKAERRKDYLRDI